MKFDVNSKKIGSSVLGITLKSLAWVLVCFELSITSILPSGEHHSRHPRTLKLIIEVNLSNF